MNRQTSIRVTRDVLATIVLAMLRGDPDALWRAVVAQMAPPHVRRDRSECRPPDCWSLLGFGGFGGFGSWNGFFLYPGGFFAAWEMLKDGAVITSNVDTRIPEHLSRAVWLESDAGWLDGDSDDFSSHGPFSRPYQRPVIRRPSTLSEIVGDSWFMRGTWRVAINRTSTDRAARHYPYLLLFGVSGPIVEASAISACGCVEFPTPGRLGRGSLQ